ncbi:VOC family protein [Salinibacillus xinjiangensis]|uniref:hypothetical protein n=1 Tax=Salinibacillus xinjiangensis TaxID=1229268 RepID=UPI001E32A561|nr:hypothetical protein [Salinibacillus xinjiangensis]
MRISLEFESEAEIRKIYDALAAEGQKISLELQESFWGAIHANLTDKYGFGLLLNFEK